MQRIIGGYKMKSVVKMPPKMQPHVFYKNQSKKRRFSPRGENRQNFARSFWAFLLWTEIIKRNRSVYKKERDVL